MRQEAKEEEGREGQVKGRLIVQPKRVRECLAHPVVWPSDSEIPQGWEELELVAGFQGTTRVEPSALDGACDCTHRRNHHNRYQHSCLVQGCECKRFEGAG